MMNILVINCGSSSQNFKVYRVEKPGLNRVIAYGKARNVATTTREHARIDWVMNGESPTKEIDLPSHQSAAREIIKIIDEGGIIIDAIGHRFVHGGTWLTETTLVTTESIKILEKCLPLAPIHNPNSYHVLQVYREHMPQVPEYVVFDTAFHSLLPEEARQYALPQALAEHYGFQKYGFHGLSYQYVSQKAAEFLGIHLNNVKLIMCHLGTGGSSVAAFKDGHTIDTSMGYSPLPGLVMSTRSGDLDPEIVLQLIKLGYSADRISQILNNESGLIGLSGYSSNLAEIIQAAERGNERCRIAYEVYANRLKTYIGGYFWQMNGADALIFTDDIGTHSWKLREKVCGNVQQLGIRLDLDANRNAKADQPQILNAQDSGVKIISMPTDEEQVILKEVVNALSAK